MRRVKDFGNFLNSRDINCKARAPFWIMIDGVQHVVIINTQKFIDANVAAYHCQEGWCLPTGAKQFGFPPNTIITCIGHDQRQEMFFKFGMQGRIKRFNSSLVYLLCASRDSPSGIRCTCNRIVPVKVFEKIETLSPLMRFNIMQYQPLPFSFVSPKILDALPILMLHHGNKIVL